MSRRLVSFLILVISVVLISNPSFAGARKAKGEVCNKDGQTQVCPAMEKLNLTEKQEADITAIQAKYAKLMKGSHDKIKALKKKLDAGFRSSASNESLQKLFKDLQAEKNAKHELRFAKSLEIRTLLTKEQRKNFGPCGKGPHGKGDCMKPHCRSDKTKDCSKGMNPHKCEHAK